MAHLLQRHGRSWRLLVLAAVGLALVGSATLLRSASAPASGCAEVNDLIAANPHFLQLEPGTYDNSCATLTVPNGYHLVGRGDASMIFLPNQSGDLANIGAHASISRVRLQVVGVPNDVTPGVSPCTGCGGVKLQTHAEVDHVRLQGSNQGFILYGDHVRVRDSVATKNFYALYQDNPPTIGNADVTGNDFTGNAQASVGIGPYQQLDSAYFRNNHMGFSPYCYKAEGSRATREFAISNIDSASDSCESPTKGGYIFGCRSISGTFTMPRSGPVFSNPNDPDGGKIWEAWEPAPARSPGSGVQTLILAGGGDTTNGPLLSGTFDVHSNANPC